MDMKLKGKDRPIMVNYGLNMEQYFIDLDIWYREFGRPKEYKIHDRRIIIHRSILGKFKVPITRYYVFDSNGKRKIKTISEQENEIRNLYVLNDFIKRKICSNESYLETSKSINFAYSKSWIGSKSIEISGLKTNNSIGKFESISNKIYVEVDDCFQKIRDENNQIHMYRNRLLVIHQGKINGKIINKTIVLETLKTNTKGLDIQKLSSKIRQIIYQNYGLNSPEICVFSDGARWMKRLSKELNATHILDFWHVINRLIKAIGYGWYNTKNSKIYKKFELIFGQNCYQFIKKLIKKGDISSALKWLIFIKRQVQNQVSETKIIEINSLIRYLINNQNLLKNYSNFSDFGSHTEAFISHFIKKKTTKKFGIYGLKRFKFFIKNQENFNQKVIFI